MLSSSSSQYGTPGVTFHSHIPIKIQNCNFVNTEVDNEVNGTGEPYLPIERIVRGSLKYWQSHSIESRHFQNMASYVVLHEI